MEYVYTTSGRENYFRGKSGSGDCVIRAIVNATGLDYKDVYNDLFTLIRISWKSKHEKDLSPINGVYPRITKRYIENYLGFKWISCSGIGVGCKVHLNEQELPKGTIIARVSRHVVCVRDGVIYDKYDPSRGGTRMVYGYWEAPKGWDITKYIKPVDKCLSSRG